MRYLLLLAFLVCPIGLFCQEKISAGLELNFPIIPDFNNNIQHLTFKGTPGCSINGNYEIPIVLLNNLSVSFGLNLNLLKFERKYTNDSNDYVSNEIINNPANTFKTPYLYNPISNTTAYYIGLPIEFLYSIVQFKLDVLLGINNTWLLYNNQKTHYSFITSEGINGKQIYTYGIESADENKGLYKSVTYLNVGVSYNVYDKIYITASYNLAVTPLYESAYQLLSTQHNNIFTIGAKYYIWQYK
jgi:hypothetical protein